jgi:hypothetical protein
MKRVFIARGVSEAHLVRAYLENAGIDASVRGEELSTVFGGIPIDGESLPSVWVAEDSDYDRALDLIHQTSRYSGPGPPCEAEADDAADWQCPRCQETVDGWLTICWNCGTERVAE